MHSTVHATAPALVKIVLHKCTTQGRQLHYKCAPRYTNCPCHILYIAYCCIQWTVVITQLSDSVCTVMHTTEHHDTNTGLPYLSTPLMCLCHLSFSILFEHYHCIASCSDTENEGTLPPTTWNAKMKHTRHRAANTQRILRKSRHDRQPTYIVHHLGDSIRAHTT